MSIIHKFREYLLEEEFSVTVYKDRISILNYKKIGHFDSNKICIIHETGKIIITGNYLVVSKLMNDEILVKGKIDNVELR